MDASAAELQAIAMDAAREGGERRRDALLTVEECAGCELTRAAASRAARVTAAELTRAAASRAAAGGAGGGRRRRSQFWQPAGVLLVLGGLQVLSKNRGSGVVAGDGSARGERRV